MTDSGSDHNAYQHSERIRVAIWQRLFYLWDLWDEFRALIVISDRSDAFISSAPHFFSVVSNAMLFEVSVSICALLDPLTTAGRHNLVLEQLTLDTSLAGSSEVVAELKRLIAASKEYSSTIRAYRNKVMSHADRDTSLRSVEPLPGLILQEYEMTLGAMLDTFSYYCERTNRDADMTDWIPGHRRGGKALSAILKIGLTTKGEGN